MTLQCDGHAITGSWKGTGIYLYGRSDVTVRSCTVKNFVYGIYLYVS
ncbi:MAG: DUF1565 domain-containing protein, partial [Phycisphaerae bacterium]|nr:DUF1565 domain-containing protein [Phycisphaerae bacterium]NIP55204.1 DUF1565 domain-containing protein [Phycisphaerae bacterium]